MATPSDDFYALKRDIRKLLRGAISLQEKEASKAPLGERRQFSRHLRTISDLERAVSMVEFLPYTAKEEEPPPPRRAIDRGGKT